MANARFFRLLAVLALLTMLGLNVAWLLGDWFPTGADEIAHLQAAANTASALASSPGSALLDIWTGHTANPALRSPSVVQLGAAPLCWLPGLRTPLLTLLPALLLLLWAAGTSAHNLATRLPQTAQLGSVADVERRMGVGGKTATMLQDAHRASAWRAVLLALTPAVMLVEHRHHGLVPFLACLAMASVALMVRSRGLRHRGLSLAWAVTVAMGLLCHPGTMIALLWAPMLVVFLQPGERRLRLGNLAMAMVLVGSMAGPRCYSWWVQVQPIDVSAARDPMLWLERVSEYAAWLPLQGLGVVASILMLAGLLGYFAHRPSWDVGLLSWVAALVSPLPLLLHAPIGQGGIALFLIGPLAVLAGVGWGRSRVHTSAGGTSLLALGTALVVVSHAHSSSLISLSLGSLAPMTDIVGAPHDEADRASLEWLDADRGAAALDLVGAEDRWGWGWLRYLLSAHRPQLEVDWPTVELHSTARQSRFLDTPCDLGRLLVIHREDPWFHSAEVARPLVPALTAPAQRQAWTDAIALARRCYTVQRVLSTPAGERLTFLVRRDKVAELLATHPRGGAPTAPDTYPSVDLEPEPKP